MGIKDGLKPSGVVKTNGVYSGVVHAHVFNKLYIARDSNNHWGIFLDKELTKKLDNFDELVKYINDGYSFLYYFHDYFYEANYYIDKNYNEFTATSFIANTGNVEIGQLVITTIVFKRNTDTNEIEFFTTRDSLLEYQ